MVQDKLFGRIWDNIYRTMDAANPIVSYAKLANEKLRPSPCDLFKPIATLTELLGYSAQLYNPPENGEIETFRCSL